VRRGQVPRAKFPLRSATESGSPDGMPRPSRVRHQHRRFGQARIDVPVDPASSAAESWPRRRPSGQSREIGSDAQGWIVEHYARERVGNAGDFRDTIRDALRSVCQDFGIRPLTSISMGARARNMLIMSRGSDGRRAAPRHGRRDRISNAIAHASYSSRCDNGLRPMRTYRRGAASARIRSCQHPSGARGHDGRIGQSGPLHLARSGIAGRERRSHRHVYLISNCPSSSWGKKSLGSASSIVAVTTSTRPAPHTRPPGVPAPSEGSVRNAPALSEWPDSRTRLSAASRRRTRSRGEDC